MHGTEGEPWAETEFGNAELGDRRRTVRLVELATVCGSQPTASLPAASHDAAMLKAAYRFFDNDAIDPAAMLASHIMATRRRLAQVPLVLAVQDTTLLDWTTHPATTGLGPLAVLTHQGLLAHTTLALTPERVPLGLLAQAVWARDPELRRHQDHKQRPIEEKESQKWLHSLQAVSAARQDCPTTQFISIGDREADVYDLFVVARPPGVESLIRAAWDRKVAHTEKYLWAALASARVAATTTVRVPRRGDQPARVATLTVRYRPVILRPPNSRAKDSLPNVPVWTVWVVEERPPPGSPAVEWLLLTTVSVTSAEEALERVAWYACRWGIEVWHKLLKSGCRIEARQLETAERLRRCLTLYSVIAWRIQYATLLARAAPELPCTVLLEAEEWQALWVTIHKRATPPGRPPSLGEAVRWIGQLGGFLGRTRDGEPGAEVVWKGFQHLVDLTTMYRIMRPTASHPNVGND